MAALALPLALNACTPPASETAEARPPLEGAAIGGDFSLTDKSGKTVRYADSNGQYRIIYFGYTYCPDVCPVDLQKLMQGFRLFEKSQPALAQKVQPIFITIDPERDTQAVVGEYAAAFHPRLIGLTGSKQAIADAANKFAIYYARIEGNSAAGGSADYLMDHSRQAYLMAPDGKPMVLLSVDKKPDSRPSTPQDIAAELEQWVKG